MKNILAIILTSLFVFNSCSSKDLIIYVDNGNDKELQNLNYKILLNDKIVVDNKIIYEEKIPSYKIFEIKRDGEKKVSVSVNNKIIDKIILKKDTHYLFISIYKDEMGVFKVYFLESERRIKPA